MMAGIGSWPCVLSKQSHVKVTCFLCPRTVQYPSRSKRRETEVSYAPTPTLTSNASGWGFCFFHAAKSTPSLAPRACRRLGGFSFFFMLSSPLPLRAPLPCVNAPCPCMLSRHLRMPGQPRPCVPGQRPHTLRQHPRLCASGSMPPVSARWIEAPTRCVSAPVPARWANAPCPCALG